MFLPVPLDLIALVKAATGIALPGDMKIAVVDNDTDFLRHEAQPGILYIAPGAEQDGQIYLPVRSAVHMQEEMLRAVLVHELVHVAQEKSKKLYACAGQREAEAYQLQNDYLLAHDLPTVVNADALTVMRGCRVVAAAD